MRSELDDAFLFLVIGNEVALNAHYDMNEEGRAAIVTQQRKDYNQHLLAALVLASVVEMVPPGVHVKLLTCIRLLEENAKSAPERDIPF